MLPKNTKLMPTLYNTGRRKKYTRNFNHLSSISHQSNTTISGSCAPIVLLLPPSPLRVALLLRVDFVLPKGTADAAVAAGVELQADDVALAAFLPTACFLFGRVTSLSSLGDA